LIKFENSFKSYIDENITIDENSKKLILDFSRYNQKNINFQTNISLYVKHTNKTKHFLFSFFYLLFPKIRLFFTVF